MKNEVYKKLKKVQKELNQAFAERKLVIDGCLTALIAGEHVLTLGPPGTAKSIMARTLASCAANDSFFEILLTKFTSMEEVFGPVSFKGLKEDRYERILDGYAGASEVVFFDEIWKASSSILNSTLTLMQERIVHNNAKPVKTPLKMVIGASNEYPQDESLAALFDRFSMKFWVDYIADADKLGKLIENGGIQKPKEKLTDDELKVLREEACKMQFANGVVKTLLAIKEAIQEDGFLASDRTWVKAVKLIKARAVLNGHKSVQKSDFTVLADILWKEHTERPKLRKLIGNAADPYGSRAEAIIDGVKAAMKDMPTMDVLKSGQKTKVEMITIMADINRKVMIEYDKIEDVAKDAGEESPSIKEAKETTNSAIKLVQKLMDEVTFHRGQ